MKVRIAFTMEVDEERWATEFGVEPENVRQDVKDYFWGTLGEHYLMGGIIKDIKEA